jgi:tRNA U34 5-carboxymethylaminomethyl modifying enzyme MnmG/GidA
MNVVGKIFTVLILVMCLAFMTFSLMLYAAHTDWRNMVIAKPGGLDDQLRAANAEKKQLVDEKKHLEDRIVEEKDRYVKRLAALEREKNDLLKVRTANEEELHGKEVALSKLVDTIDQNHKDVQSRHAETLTLREETKKAIEERRSAFLKVVGINDQLLNAVVERLQLAKLGTELRSQLMRMSPTANPVANPNHN